MDGFGKLLELQDLMKWSDEARAASLEARRGLGVVLKEGNLPGVVMVNSPRATKLGDKLVKVPIDLIEEAFKKDESVYIGKGGSGEIAGRYKRFEDFLRAGNPIEAPEVSLSKQKDGSLRVGFTNGRHRFAVLRDVGYREIGLSLSKDSIRALRG